MEAIDFHGIYLLFGGDEGNRTPGLLNAIQALSHLSYIPGKLSVNSDKVYYNGFIRPCQHRHTGSICQDNSGAFPSEVILLYNFFAVKTDNSKSPALTAFFESATVVIHLKLGSK